MFTHKKMIFPMEKKCTMDTFQTLIEDIKKRNPTAKDFNFDFYSLKKSNKKKIVIDFIHEVAQQKTQVVQNGNKICVIVSNKNLNSVEIMRFLTNLYREIKFDLKIVHYNNCNQTSYPKEKTTLLSKIDNVQSTSQSMTEQAGYVNILHIFINQGKYNKIYYIKEPTLPTSHVKGVRYLSTYFVSTYSHNTVIEKFFIDNSSVICL